MNIYKKYKIEKEIKKEMDRRTKLIIDELNIKTAKNINSLIYMSKMIGLREFK